MERCLFPRICSAQQARASLMCSPRLSRAANEHQDCPEAITAHSMRALKRVGARGACPATSIADPICTLLRTASTLSVQHTMAPPNSPKTSEQLIVSFPKEHVLLLTFNRPKQLNAMTPQMQNDLKQMLNWFEDEPSLW